LMGMGEAAMFPAAYDLYSRWVPERERSRAIALLLSGIPIGTLFALTVTGWIVSQYGWPSVFYIFGASGILFTVVWFAAAYNSPAEHPTISAEEKNLLASVAAKTAGDGAVPWRRIFSERAVWALIINHFCSNWTFYVLLAWLPSYFRDVQNLSLTGAGLYSAAPWLTMFVMSNLGAWAADGMIARGMSVTRVRKIMQITGLLGAAVFLLLVKDATTLAGATIFLCFACGILALTWAGFAPNHLEIAPRHASVLLGVTNTAGTLPGIIGVYVTGWLIDRTGTFDAAFVLAAGVSVVGAVIWAAFGTSKKVID
ncbi:MAG: MFS transporter, partial [Pseudomonadota bacterium]